MNLIEEALPIWNDAFDRVRLGDEAWWSIAPMAIPVQGPTGVTGQVAHCFALWMRSPVLGGPAISSIVMISDALALLRREAAEEAIRAALEFCRTEIARQLSISNGSAH